MVAAELVVSGRGDLALPADSPPEAAAGGRERGPGVAPDRERPFVYDGVRAGRALRAGLSKRAAFSRPLPMEDVYFHIKELDNRDIRRQSDPADKTAWARFVGAGLLGLTLVILTFAPRPLLRHSGYRLENLQQRHQALASIQGQLMVRQEMLSDLRRVATLAGKQGLSQTPPERFAWQNQTTPPLSGTGELAWNEMKVQP
jgi:hypothetical protein